MSLGLDNLVLEEVFVLLKGSCTGLPVLDLFVQVLLFLRHLHSLFVEAVHLLVQLVDHLILECVVAVFGIQLLDQRLQLLLLSLHVDRVALEVVVLLLFQLTVKLGVELLNHGV